ncbi:MAG: hypothetical protein A3D96_05020 [Chlamydiae bacterium RIFCSPHIGHO2_12_FULL_44_59]|nr:MAG: hypothetical protein A2796_03315 [Chlamydiae bacterium RIFCSPHIGHO2_01_FULL_44_39]OGN58815.1 MAG: hypothetical protein A3C42_01925 [Chlamydiae bacterium RIFCSPHIGHO2_02_FULL_45_9]OGN60182.1 MAG: hypothetical protein A3D96_05020 [Chlamydiae bacterium RIFCSPHIGHO2_12_FULL_44_59]OGN67165.1 MAG: hypothetical protein A2978_01020 [Chlamydiae bacterium RIFCSPLOWO2_01_FULL_44_52]OGN67755.1 MAG: hypothetical protein A3I67_04955 [Chlamydiae bacterium RIFCSPLOWO2_02_FULL_45_22]OGN71458.1 MAG: hyp
MHDNPCAYLFLSLLHWVLDVIFKEDTAQAKTGFIAENMAFFRRLSMNVIKVAVRIVGSPMLDDFARMNQNI